MDGSMQRRKAELELECEVDASVFAGVTERMVEFMEPFLGSFSRRTQAGHATRFVQGLCSNLESKNAESMAYLFRLDRKTLQHFVGESAWEDRPLRDELIRQVGAQLGEAEGVIAFDPSSFPKSGKQSVGVGRQWCGRLGKIDNCQVGVYMAYVSSHGHAFVDVEMSLPHAWTDDKSRLEQAGVPKPNQKFRKRWQLCLDMLDRHGSRLPHAWITGDDEFGKPAEFRRELRIATSATCWLCRATRPFVTSKFPRSRLLRRARAPSARDALHSVSTRGRMSVRRPSGPASMCAMERRGRS